MKVAIVGHGAAGLMLGSYLASKGMDIVVIGKGETQEPPKAMVHLYAGRSFRRSELELEAFRYAVDYWKKNNAALETKVRRVTNDRLERSLEETIKYEWEPPTRFEKWFSYGPAFIVDTMKLKATCQKTIRYIEAKVEANADSDASKEVKDILEKSEIVIWATGAETKASFCENNGGVMIKLLKLHQSLEIKIGNGIHTATTSDTLTVGGAFLNGTPNPREALLERAKLLLDEKELEALKKGTTFVGQKSVSLDRLPVVGFDEEGKFWFTAFGARAFFWLPFTCEITYRLLLKEIPSSPFSPTRWS